MGHATIPVIDLSSLVKPETESWVSTRAAVKSAMEEYGCFQATYDVVVDREEVDSTPIFKAIEELFDLPEEIKIQNTSTKPLFGSSVRSDANPLFETLAIDNPTSGEATRSFTNLMWPAAGNDGFCKTSLSISKRMAELHDKVLKMVKESYNVELGFPDDSMNYLLRYLKYHTPSLNHSDVGLRAHSDKSFISVIHQNHLNGLQIQLPDETQRWVDVDLTSPPAGSFFVLAGDVLVAWSNERIRSCVHRVIVQREKEDSRYCVTLFSYVERGIEIQSPDEFVDEAHPSKYRPFDNLGYLDEVLKSVMMNQPILTIKDYCGL